MRASFAAPVHAVQHHWAHVLSCMAENEVEPPALGVSWDGTGYGTDGTIWGGEFLLARGGSFERVARFRQFRLPGGEVAIRQPSRAALGVLFEIWGEDALGRRDIPPVRDFLADRTPGDPAECSLRGLNAPVTSSAGRLFDAVASLIGLRHRVSFEGQAAMELEFAIQLGINASYPFELRDGSPLIVDWGSAIEAIVGDVASGRHCRRNLREISQHAGGDRQGCRAPDRRGKDRSDGRLFSESAPYRSVFETSAGCRLSALLAPARTAQRRGNLAGASRRCRGSASSESFRKSTCRRMNLLYAEIIKVFSEHGMQMGIVRVGGARKKIALDLLTNPSLWRYSLVV